jgi:hypothetical protein
MERIRRGDAGYRLRRQPRRARPRRRATIDMLGDIDTDHVTIARVTVGHNMSRDGSAGRLDDLELPLDVIRTGHHGRARSFGSGTRVLVPTVRAAGSVSCLSKQIRTIRIPSMRSAALSERSRSTSSLIDGDHRYEVVRLDCELYEPLARPGGHSTTSSSAPPAATFTDCGDVNVIRRRLNSSTTQPSKGTAYV